MPTRYGLWLGLALLTAPPSLCADPATLASIDARYDETARIARSLWEFAEVGYLERKSTQLLQQALADEGFRVTPGVGGMPTAFMAEFGKGEPVIGILAEMDALPGINQDSVPERSPIRGKLAAHACGHNLFGAGSVTAAVAIRHYLERTARPGTVRVYGTPAEEGGSGKVYLVRAGLLDDVDIAMHWHPSDENTARARTSLANRSAKFRFRGRSAHAAGAPEKARSALDGVEAFNFMANLMREHVPQQTRMHYVITQGGLAPNVVPDFAEVFYYLRHPDSATLTELWARLEQAARAAALGTGTEVDWEIIHGNHPIVVNEILHKIADVKLQAIGGVRYDADERAFADRIYATLAAPTATIDSAAEIQPYDVSLGYGSTDVGDVSIKVPTVGVRAATWVPGTPSHSWQAAAAGGTSIGFKGAQVAAKALALTAIELYEDPTIVAAAKAEHAERVGDDFVYEALLGDRAPPLNYRVR
ncbi:MAG: amidohydrolase [Pseudomonadota bacterium]